MRMNIPRGKNKFGTCNKLQISMTVPEDPGQLATIKSESEGKAMSSLSDSSDDDVS